MFGTSSVPDVRRFQSSGPLFAIRGAKPTAVARENQFKSNERYAVEKKEICIEWEEEKAIEIAALKYENEAYIMT